MGVIMASRMRWGVAMKTIIAALVLASITSAAQAEDCSNPFVKTPESAGWIAFAMWHLLYPSFPETDEKNGYRDTRSRSKTVFGPSRLSQPLTMA